MEINGKECLSLLHCDSHGDRILHLDKGGALRLINGTPITSARVAAEFGYLDLAYTIPLKLVPLRWGLILWGKLGLPRAMWYHDQWDKIHIYQDPIKRVNTSITDFKIGVIKE